MVVRGNDIVEDEDRSFDLENEVGWPRKKEEWTPTIWQNR